jgi:hypothetical protein
MANTELSKGNPVKQIFTTQMGDQEEILVPRNHNVTAAIKCGSSDVISIKAKLVKDSEEYVILNEISEDFFNSLVSDVYSFTLNIVTNVSNNITFELISSPK